MFFTHNCNGVCNGNFPPLLFSDENWSVKKEEELESKNKHKTQA